MTNPMQENANSIRRGIERLEWLQERCTDIVDRFGPECIGGPNEGLTWYHGSGDYLLITDGNYGLPAFNGPWCVCAVTADGDTKQQIEVQSGDWEGFHQALLSGIVAIGAEDDFS